MPTCDVFGVSFLNLLLINANQQRFTSHRIQLPPPCQLQLNFRCDPVQRNPHPQQAFGLSPQRAGLAATLLELLPGSGTEPLVSRPTSLVSSRLVFCLLLINANQRRFTSRRILASTSLSTSLNFRWIWFTQSSPTTSIRPITSGSVSPRHSSNSCRAAARSRLFHGRPVSSQWWNALLVRRIVR